MAMNRALLLCFFVGLLVCTLAAQSAAQVADPSEAVSGGPLAQDKPATPETEADSADPSKVEGAEHAPGDIDNPFEMRKFPHVVMGH
ncbi:hypothetical protein ACLOJK_003632 [Asimina triloba]